MENRKEGLQPDELFRKRLESFESEVSPDLWMKVKQAQQVKQIQKRSFHKWLIAASIASILVVGMFWIRFEKGSSDTGQQVVSVDTVNKTDGADQQGAEPVPESPYVNTEDAQFVSNASVGADNVHKPAETNKKPVVTVTETTSSVVKETDSNPSVLLVDNSTVQTASTQTKLQPDTEPETRVFIVYVNPPASSEIMDVELDSTNSTSVVLTDITENAPAQKKKGVQKLFAQLKRAKSGGKVNWSELGFDPKKVLAKIESPQSPVVENLD